MFISTILFGLAFFCSYEGAAAANRDIDNLSANIAASISHDLELGERAEPGSGGILYEAVRHVGPQLDQLASMMSPQEAADTVIERLVSDNEGNGLATRMGRQRLGHLAQIMRNAILRRQYLGK
uniref:Uncharacterized protein n=1 Tax=Graphocephala atropunctata TaxID=36148 RepID=A0A1B6L8D4_9HEMI